MLDTRSDRERLRSISPHDFERFVAELWERQGWRAEVSPEGADRGVDIQAWRDDGLVEQKLAIQAKRYTPPNKVGRPEVQQYHALKQQDRSVDAVVVVTTGTFTDPAEEWADTHNIKLVDIDDLLRLIEENECGDLIDRYSTRSQGSVDLDQEPSTNRSGEGEEIDLPEGSSKALAAILGAAVIASFTNAEVGVIAIIVAGLYTAHIIAE